MKLLFSFFLCRLLVANAQKCLRGHKNETQLTIKGQPTVTIPIQFRHITLQQKDGQDFDEEYPVFRQQFPKPLNYLKKK